MDEKKVVCLLGGFLSHVDILSVGFGISTFSWISLASKTSLSS
jgi:hypothetical protein